MNRNRSIAVLLVLSVLLAGCAGIGGSDTTTTTTTTTDAPTSTSASTATTTSDSAATTTSSSASTTTTTTTTTEASWSPPTAPNTPLDDKSEPGRLKSVKLVDKEQAKSGNGYSNFNVEVVANTTMKKVDPEPLVDGDPYFLVQINGKNVGRTNVRFQHDSGTYNVEIEKGAFEQFNDGTLKVTVYLLDEDHQHDDIYGKWTGTIKYSSK